MDITEAIQALQILSDNLSAEITERTTRKAAVDTSILQLQGTLVTNLADLDAARAEITTLLDQIATLQQTNIQLADQITALQTVDNPV